MDNDVFAQIGLVMLIGLAAKNDAARGGGDANGHAAFPFKPRASARVDASRPNWAEHVSLPA